MAMGTERSKPLHNFNLPCDLRWANQRFLRCMKVDGADSSGSSDHLPVQQRRSTRDRPNGSPRIDRAPPYAAAIDGGDGGIAATREKVMLDLQTAADRMKIAFFKDGESATAAAEGEASRPWNLRTRRAACNKAPVVSKAAATATVEKSPIQKSDGGATAARGEGKERAKFAVSLSKRDVEEDFFAIVGHRPPRRPKKRARTVQKQLDTLFPGLWLTEVTPDMYKVPESAP